MTITELIVVSGLAGYRLSWAISKDGISEWIRDTISQEAEQPGAGRLIKMYNEMIGCPVCVGFWITLVICGSLAEMTTVLSWHTELATMIAATGVQYFLSKITPDVKR